jgi:hypothetical protein
MVSLFSAYLTPDTKAHVSYCHHLTSVFVVVFCKFFTLQSSSIQSVRLLLVLFGNSAWLTWPKMCSDRQIFQKYASAVMAVFNTWSDGIMNKNFVLFLYSLVLIIANYCNEFRVDFYSCYFKTCYILVLFLDSADPIPQYYII